MKQQLKKLALLAAFAAGISGAAAKDIALLNVSYDPTRELYSHINEAFSAKYQKETGDKVTISQSHGGSSKQARAVIDGLEADVVTLALAGDIDAIADNAHLLSPDWQKKLPDNSTPYTSTIVFLVRKGNPKGIKDWSDLVKPGVTFITPSPKTSGGGQWNFLAAWGYALKKSGGDEAKAREFVTEFFKHVPVLDSGARGATTSFTERGLGDALVAWENEAILSLKELGDKFEVIYPPTTILAEPPVAVVEKIAEKHGTAKTAEAYLKFLYTPEAQEIIAKDGYRPRDAAVAKKYASSFPPVQLFTIDEIAGGWKKSKEKFFNDGAIFDQIYKPAAAPKS